MRRYYSYVASAFPIYFTHTTVYRHNGNQIRSNAAAPTTPVTTTGHTTPSQTRTRVGAKKQKRQQQQQTALPAESAANAYPSPEEAFQEILHDVQQAAAAGSHGLSSAPTPTPTDTAARLHRLVEAVDGNMCLVSPRAVTRVCGLVVRMEERHAAHPCLFRTALLRIEEEMMKHTIYTLSRNIHAFGASASSLKADGAQAQAGQHAAMWMNLIREVAALYRYNEGRTAKKDTYRQALVSQLLVPALSLYFNQLERQGPTKDPQRPPLMLEAMQETAEEIRLWLLLYYTCLHASPTATMQNQIYESMQASFQKGSILLEQLRERIDGAGTDEHTDTGCWGAPVTDMVEQVMAQTTTVTVHLEHTPEGPSRSYTDPLLSFVEKGFSVFRRTHHGGVTLAGTLLIKRWIALLHKVLCQWGALVAGDDARDQVRRCGLTRQTERLIRDGIYFLCTGMGSEQDDANARRNTLFPALFAASSGVSASAVHCWCQLSDLTEFYRRTCAVSVIVPSARSKRREVCEPLMFYLLQEGLRSLMKTASPSTMASASLSDRVGAITLLPFLILFLRLWQSWLPVLAAPHVQTLSHTLLRHVSTIPTAGDDGPRAPSALVHYVPRSNPDVLRSAIRTEKKLQSALAALVLPTLHTIMEGLGELSPTPADTLTLLVESARLLSSAGQQAGAGPPPGWAAPLLPHSLLQSVLHSSNAFITRLRNGAQQTCRTPLSRLLSVAWGRPEQETERRVWDHTFLSAWLCFCAQYSGTGFPPSRVYLRHRESGDSSSISSPSFSTSSDERVSVDPQTEESAEALAGTAHLPVRTWCAMDDPQVALLLALLNACVCDCHTLAHEMDVYRGVLISQLVEACEPSGLSWKQLVTPPPTTTTSSSPERLFYPQPFLLCLGGLPVSPLRAPAACSAYVWQRLRELYPVEGDGLERCQLIAPFACDEATKTHQREAHHLAEEAESQQTCCKGTFTHMRHVLTFWQERYASCWLLYTQADLFSQRALVAAQQDKTHVPPLRSVSYVKVPTGHHNLSHLAYVNTYHLHAMWIVLCDFFSSFLEALCHCAETVPSLDAFNHLSARSVEGQTAAVWRMALSFRQRHSASARDCAVLQKRSTQLAAWHTYLRDLWREKTYVSAADAYRSLEAIMQQPASWAAAGLPTTFLFQLWSAAYQDGSGSWDPQQLEDLAAFYAVLYLLDRLERLQREAVRCVLWLHLQPQQKKRNTRDGAPVTAAAASFLRSSVAEVLREQWQHATEKVTTELQAGAPSAGELRRDRVFRFSDAGLVFYAHLLRRSPVQEVLHECVFAPNSDKQEQEAAQVPTDAAWALKDVLLDLSVSSRVLASQLRTTVLDSQPPKR